ncbi:hypothetical protein QN416_25885, partial [Glaciimonas sp. Cout2]|nr:hypothetical protein [Glaciimonas sp. Cout2]
ETADAAQATLARLNATHGEPWTSDPLILADTAEAVAPQLLHWHKLGIDGVRLRPARLPEDLSAITESVVPLLRSAGVLDRPDGVA